MRQELFVCITPGIQLLRAGTPTPTPQLLNVSSNSNESQCMALTADMLLFITDGIMFSQ